MAPIIAIQAGSKCVSGLRKKDTITHPSTVPHLRGQNGVSGVGGKFARESEGENKKGGGWWGGGERRGREKAATDGEGADLMRRARSVIGYSFSSFSMSASSSPSKNSP